MVCFGLDFALLKQRDVAVIAHGQDTRTKRQLPRPSLLLRVRDVTDNAAWTLQLFPTGELSLVDPLTNPIHRLGEEILFPGGSHSPRPVPG
jgi:hypothetical protein